MELFETQKSSCKEDICETCAYVELDITDDEYSPKQYAGDCLYDTNGRQLAENIIEEMWDSKASRNYCPLYVPHFPLESELIRCPACNSTCWEEIPSSYYKGTEKLKCEHCEEIVTESVHRIAYSYNIRSLPI